MAIYGVHLAQVLVGTLPAILGLLAVLSVGVLLVTRSTAPQGARPGTRLVLEPAPVPVTRTDAITPPAVLLRSTLASRAPPGAWPNRPIPSSALRAEE